MLIHSAERGLENLFVTMLVLSEFAWYTCIRNKHSLILFLCTQNRTIIGKGSWEKYRELSAAGWSIIRQSRRLRQIIAFQDTNNQRYFTITCFILLFRELVDHWLRSTFMVFYCRLELLSLSISLPFRHCQNTFQSFHCLLCTLFSLSFFSALLIRLTQILDDSLEALVNEL